MTSGILHRVRGRAALTRRLGGLLIATHRFARARATTPADRAWAARMLDVLQTALSAANAPDDPRAALADATLRDQRTAQASGRLTGRAVQAGVQRLGDEGLEQ